MTGPGPDAWMGVDVGTQGVRALVVTGDGTVLGRGSSPLTGVRDGDRHEQDPGDWWYAARTAIRQALATVAGPGRIRGVAVDATSGTITLLDAKGRYLTPGLMYDDQRAGAETDRVNAVGEARWARAGYRRMQRSWALPKLCRLLAEHPRAAEDGLRLAHQSDVIDIRLTGDPAVPTDTGSALKTGADVGDLTWPEDVLGQLGVDPRMLPDLVLPGTVVGQVCAEAAEETGLPEGTDVVAGTTDGCAAQLASGATAVGRWNSVLGTTLVLKGVSRTLVHDPHGVVYSHRSPTGHWLPGGASGTGAGLIAREFAGADLDRLTREAEPLLPTGLLRYPLVSPGERFPFVAPEARAFGTGQPADDAEAFAALLQGVSYVERLCFDYVDLLGAPVDGPVHLTGGASRNPVWNQLRSDVLGRPVALPRNAEPALGAAILAASSGTPLDVVAAATVRVDTVLEPRAATRDRHLDGYLRLTGLLAERGWLPGAVAAHATEGAGR